MIRKYYVFLMLIGSLCVQQNVLAQTSEYLAKGDITMLFWQGDLPKPEFKQEWKEESAVFLEKFRSFNVDKGSMWQFGQFHIQSHDVIYLNDADAVKEFSELEITIPYTKNYYTSNNKFFINLRVIKPSGDVIYLKDENIVEHNGQTLKIAVPSLEAGDILDFFKYVDMVQNFTVFYVSDLMSYEFNGKYPIKYQKLEIITNKFSELQYSQYNNAPSFVENKIDKNLKSHTIEMKDAEAFESVRWLNLYKELPYVEYVILYATKKGRRNYDGYSALHSSFSDKKSNHQYLFDYLNHTRNKYEYTVTGKVINRIIGTLAITADPLENEVVRILKKELLRGKKKGLGNVENVASAWDKTKMVYLANRVPIEYYYAENADNGRPHYSTINEVSEVARMSRALKLAKIPHDIILTYSTNTNKSINNNPYLDYVHAYILVKENGKEIYLSGLSTYKKAGEIAADNYNAAAIMYTVPKRGKYIKQPGKAFIMPGTSHNEHYESTVISVTPDLEDERLNLAITNTKAGEQMLSDRYQLLRGTNFIENARYDELGINYKKGLKYRQRRELDDLKVEFAEKDAKANLDWFEADAKSSFKVENLQVEDFTLEQTGSWYDQPNLVYSGSFTTEDYITKVGPNYLIKVGKLIGGQVEITNEERKEGREYPIYFGQTRQFVNSIKVDIPDGFNVVELDKLNSKIDNEVGTFEVSTSVADNKALITVTKIYKVGQAPADKWEQAIEFTDAAVEFGKQQLLLKPARYSRK